MTRILVADDDQDVRVALRVALEVEGYEVEAVPNGARAMQAHERRPADVLITDLFMPECDGFETVKHFRARNPGMLIRSEEHTSELQSQSNLVCRLLLE